MLSLSHTDHYLATIVIYDFQHPPLNDRTVNKKNKQTYKYIHGQFASITGRSVFFCQSTINHPMLSHYCLFMEAIGC